MHIAQFLKTVFLSLYLILTIHDANANETYYIDDRPLLLYKTINWWYYSLPEESDMLCGRRIKCNNRGNAEIAYDEQNQTLKLKIKNGFAGMLSVFKRCEPCYGPSYFQCRWINRKYFNEEASVNILKNLPVINEFSFSHIKKEHARLIQSIEHDLLIVLEGVIGGLADGQIALHGSGDLLKKCLDVTQEQEENYPIFLKIINACTDETLARFDMFWAR